MGIRCVLEWPLEKLRRFSNWRIETWWASAVAMLSGEKVRCERISWYSTVFDEILECLVSGMLARVPACKYPYLWTREGES